MFVTIPTRVVNAIYYRMSVLDVRVLNKSIITIMIE